LARAVAPRPRLLMLDEPFSSLDVELRVRLSENLREFLKASGTSALLVTHDQKEAFAIADQIGVLRNGALEQWDSAFNLYHQPATRFVADFVGRGVFVPGTVLSSTEVEIEIGKVRGSLTRHYAAGSEVDVLLRPDDILHDDDSPLAATVSHKAFRGADILYTLSLPSGAKVFSLVPSHHNHDVGSQIGIRLAADHIVAFDRESA
ncbi:MAG: ABC transporter ATP-binding protein, partial [Gammaproteobacteria bacterium]|nr:ABC transporter ATP-binding protein [Gammaproteobacteria bacterium]